MSEYIEEFVPWIDVPLLDKVYITFFDQLIFDTPRLHDFLTCIETFKAHSRRGVVFLGYSIKFKLGSLSQLLEISCRQLGR